MIAGFAHSQSYYMYDFRNVPEDELAVMTENEEHFWSKVLRIKSKKEI